MSVTPLVFYRIQNYFLFLQDKPEEECVVVNSGNMIEEDELKVLGEKAVYTSGYLKDLLSIEIADGRYFYVESKQYLMLIPKKMGQLFFSKIVKQSHAYAEKLIYKFRFEARRELIAKITRPDAELEDYLSAIRDYIFFDGFSLWAYNERTKYFTLGCTSGELEKNCLQFDEKTSLNEVLENGYSNEARSLSDSVICGFKSEGMKSLVRIKLMLGKGVGVLTLYSKRENASIHKDLMCQIKSHVEAKYNESLVENQETLAIINSELQQDLDYKDLHKYLYRAAKMVAESLCFEACSILVSDTDDKKMIVAATYDLNHDGRPDGHIDYDLTSKSLTSEVFNSGEMAFSYDLENDDRNSHKYDEETEFSGENWIGIPLKFKDNLYGVLRVKNKYCFMVEGKKKITPPRPIDFLNLETIGSAVSTFLFGQALLKSMMDKYDNLNLFNKVFMHEVRTPISKFNMGPELIKRGLSSLRIDDEVKEKIDRQLTDIQIMGGRLKFLTDSYNFDEIINKKDLKNYSLLQDIVFPVLLLTKPYHEKIHRVFFHVDHKSMRGWRVFCDQDMLNIVLNSLIDNAAKYSEGKEKKIRIYCKYKHGDEFLFLYVENTGLEILESEVEKIFGRDYRGEKARDEKVHGTGIGLYLSSCIMKEQGGNLSLESRVSPIRFVIKIPTSDEVRR